MAAKRRPKQRSKSSSRRVRTDCDACQLKALAQRVKYVGSPLHKRNPGDYGLTPPARGRDDKTLCDEVGVLRHAEAERLLKDGIIKGCISEQTMGEFPKRVWSITEDGCLLEARLGSRGSGTYHGHPVCDDNRFRKTLMRLFEKS